MRSLRKCGMALVALFAFAAFASASAGAAEFPLPTLHMALGEAFPVVGEGLLAKEKAGVLVTPLGSPIESNDVHVVLTWTSLSSLGTYTATFKGAHMGAKECWNGADGTIVVSGEAHLVDLNKETLKLGIAFLVLPKIEIKCGLALKSELVITVEGMAVGAVLAENMTQLTSVKASLQCLEKPKGAQEFKTFVGDKEETITGNLTANVGLGPEKACELVGAKGEEITINFNKMVEFLF